MYDADKEFDRLSELLDETRDFLFHQEFDFNDLANRTIKILNTVDFTSNLVSYLKKDTDFFSAPASTRFHSSFLGGLNLHSLSVMVRLIEKCLSPSMWNSGFRGFTYNNIVIASLMHDLCKANFYVEVKKWRKDERGKWESYSGWDVDDKYPYGHGEKSVMILNKFYESNPVVDIAIRWHMGPFTTNNPYDFTNACNAHPMVTLLHTADMESTYIYEVKSFKLNGSNPTVYN